MKKNTFIPLNDQASKALKGGKTTIEAFDQPSVEMIKVRASKATIEVFRSALNWLLTLTARKLRKINQRMCRCGVTGYRDKSIMLLHNFCAQKFDL